MPTLRFCSHLPSPAPHLPLWGGCLPPGADLTLLPFLTDADLEQMGMVALGARKKVLLGVAELAARGAELACAGAEVEPRQCSTDTGPLRGDAAGLLPGGSTAAAAGAAGQHAGGSSGGVGDWRVLSGAGGSTLFVGNIRRYFQPDGRCGSACCCCACC